MESEKPRVLLACPKIDSQIVHYQPIMDNYKVLSDKAILLDDILDKVLKLKPQILIYLDGIKQINYKINQLDVLRKVRQQDVRVIYCCNDRQIGDPWLDGIVQFGIYDIINDDILPLKELFDIMQHPKTFKNASKYLGKITVSDDGQSLDKDLNKVELTNDQVDFSKHGLGKNGQSKKKKGFLGLW